MAKKLKRYKVGIDSETYAISLVEYPAIEEVLVALEKQKEVKVQMTSEDKHMVYSAVLVPDKPIYRRNEDGEEFYVEFTKESIEKMSIDFMKSYRQNEITLDHETQASDITIVETWLKSDMYKDKSVALGLNPDLPVGTWFCGMKVNQIDAWERVKNGELRGFSVESLIRLEEFESQMELNTNNDMNNTNEEMFLEKIKNAFKEVLASVTLSKKEEPTQEELAANSGFTSVEDYKEEVEVIKTELEEQNAEPAPIPANEDAANTTQNPTDSEPAPAPVEEPKVEEPKVEDAANASQDATHPEPNPLEELVNSLKSEIEALKGYNSELQNKVKNLEKEPSTKPVNVNSASNNGDAYANWRSLMRNML